jgi:YVTN family beta-propeller protein
VRALAEHVGLADQLVRLRKPARRQRQHRVHPADLPEPSGQSERVGDAARRREIDFGPGDVSKLEPRHDLPQVSCDDPFGVPRSLGRLAQLAAEREHLRDGVGGDDRGCSTIECMCEHSRVTVRRAGARAQARRSWRRPLLAAIAAVILSALAAAAILITRPARTSTTQALQVLPSDSVAVIDPRANAVVAAVPVGGTPAGIAVGEGAVWVGNSRERTLVRIDPETRRVVKRIGLGAKLWRITVTAGAVWVASYEAKVLLRIDPLFNEVTDRIDVSRAGLGVGGGALPPPAEVAAGAGAIWIVHALVATHVLRNLLRRDRLQRQHERESARPTDSRRLGEGDCVRRRGRLDVERARASRTARSALTHRSGDEFGRLDEADARRRRVGRPERPGVRRGRGLGDQVSDPAEQRGALRVRFRARVSWAASSPSPTVRGISPSAKMRSGS